MRKGKLVYNFLILKAPSKWQLLTLSLLFEFFDSSVAPGWKYFGTASNFDEAWQFFNIVRNPNITVSNRKRDLNSHLISRSVCIFLPRLVYIPELSLIPRQVPDFNEQTRVSNGHPRSNSRVYPRFLPQLEKSHETFRSLRDEARFPCIVSRAIAFSKSNM